MGWLKLPSRVAAFLAGAGVLGGMFSTGHAAAGHFRTVPEAYQDVKTEIVQSGPTLLFSDSPEMVYGNGVLYRDVVEGEGRVFFHHVNGTKKVRKLAVLMRPVSHQTTITWGCRGIGDPDKQYYVSARKGQTRYFNEYRDFWKKARKTGLKEKQKKTKKGTADKNREPDYSFYQKVSDLPFTTLAKNEFAEVLSKSIGMNHAGTRLKPEQLLTGMFDFHASRPVEVVIMMCDPEEDIEKFSRTGPLLPMDEHPLRGTYDKADLTYFVKEPVQMRWFQTKALCMASADDGTFLRGIDKITDGETRNHGNYGVVYHVKFTVAGRHPVKLGINPWGGVFCGAGMLISGDRIEIARIPREDVLFGTGYEIDDIFEISPDRKKADAELLWSPPGASNVPIRVFWTIKGLEDSKKS